MGVFGSPFVHMRVSSMSNIAASFGPAGPNINIIKDLNTRLERHDR